MGSHGQWSSVASYSLGTVAKSVSDWYKMGMYLDDIKLLF